MTNNCFGILHIPSGVLFPINNTCMTLANSKQEFEKEMDLVFDYLTAPFIDEDTEMKEQQKVRLKIKKELGFSYSDAQFTTQDGASKTNSKNNPNIWLFDYIDSLRKLIENQYSYSNIDDDDRWCLVNRIEFEAVIL